MVARQLDISSKRELTDEDAVLIGDITAEAKNVLLVMENAIPEEERSERSRCMNIARTNLEQAVLWATKAILTLPE